MDLIKSNAQGRIRWSVVVLLFAATSINYLDRQVIGLLKPVLELEMNWTEADFGKMVMSFSIMYALGVLGFGALIDKIGTKIGYTISVIIWSLAAMCHAFVGSITGFCIMRGLLGLGEAGNFPAAIKTVAEWFPKKERALATGIFNSGANVGAVIAPVMVPLLLAFYGWKMAFIVTGGIGFIWLIFWIKFYQTPAKHKSLSQKEMDHILSDNEETTGSKKKWKELLTRKQTWAFIIGKFLTDPIWWFFLFWLPSYFSSVFQLDLKKPSLPLMIIYACTTIGSIGGGYLSSYLIKKGYSVYISRKASMLIFAICVIPIVSCRFVTDMWVAVGLISLAAAAHQAWSANIFTLASDLFPKSTVSSVVGLGAMGGSIGGVIFPLMVGYILTYYKSLGNITPGYNIVFLICASAYLLAWLIMYRLIPKS